VSKPRPTNRWQQDKQAIKSLGRIALVFLSLMGIAWFGAVVLQDVDFHKSGDWWLSRSFLFKFIPYREFWATAVSLPALRYYIAPIGAMFAVFLGAAFFVRDVYALPNLKEALHYIFSSMTSLGYPHLTVDAGEKQLVKGKSNLIESIGGPGLVTVQPGNVVMFRHLRRRSNITLGQNYFLEPFETIGQIANLDDQHGEKNGVGSMTRDGIKVTIKDFHFRYRIFPEMLNGRPIRRTLQDPYPFDENALAAMAYNLAVDEKGQETWRDSVGRIITGGVTDFINRHDVDYLTSPRSGGHDPRQEMRNNLTFGGPRIGLRKLGAELLWVDVGHFEIDDDSVDNVRMDLWAADWLGRAGIKIEEGRTWRELLLERARAEGQAELIAAIAESLRNAEMVNDPAGNMRRILLAKTAQVMDTMQKAARDQEKPA